MNPYPPVVDARTEGSQLAAAPDERELPFQFTGSAQEYFRIWIVNVLLTVLTLGIYSAWAKVRTKQYFYRNTWLDGTSFEFTGNPVAVLKGRILAGAALALVFGLQRYSIGLYVGSIVLLVLATPWVLVKALAFNARNSAYRNVRFAFTANAGEAAGIYLGMMLIYVFSCGIGFPYAEWRMTSFVVTRHLFGDLRPVWRSKPAAYYKTYLVALGLTLPGYVVFFLALASFKDAGTGEEAQAALQGMLIPMALAFYLYLLIPGAFLNAQKANLLYGGVELGSHVLHSKQRGVELLKLYVVNLLAIVGSLGLLIPWAKIRLARYRASCLALHATGPLVAESLLDDEPSAVGEGLADLGDFDVGIGI